MHDPVRVDLGKGVETTVARERAEVEGLKLSKDQTLYAHGRLRGTTYKGEPPEVPIEQIAPPIIPTQTSGDVAGGEPDGTSAATPKEAKK